MKLRRSREIGKINYKSFIISSFVEINELSS